MLIWLNGPFGVGKTQVAHELRARLPGSFVCDPEELGFALFKTVPEAARGPDFQDIPLWREFTRRTLEHVYREFGGPVIVPMTVAMPEYHRETVGALRASGLEVHHFTLLAPPRVVLGRLRGRGDGASSWPARQLERCLETLRSPEFAEHLDTEGCSVEEVAEAIAAKVGLRLRPRSRNRLERYARRLAVQLRHVRHL